MGDTESDAEDPTCDCKPILICEDNEFNLFTFRSILNTLQLGADWAENGEVGVSMVEKAIKTCCPYKLIFMDCYMPVMDGYKATTEIIRVLAENKGSYKKRDITQTTICALSANNVTGAEKKKCVDVGMTAFLTKPPDMGELRKVVAPLLSK